MLALIATEYLASRLKRSSAYDARETLASLAIAAGGRLIGTATTGLAALPMIWVYRHRLADPPSTPWLLPPLFLAVELCYYWHHRAMHGVSWLWATHAVHHSTTRLNLSAALRLGWGGTLTGGFLFYLPLVWLGFHPLAVLAMLGGGLTYQFFLHAVWVPRLGPLEWLLNTPAHHHVHHAANDACRDRNFGGALIVFDRLFGTFAAAPAGERLRFGLHGVAPSTGAPLQILLVGWRAVARASRDAQTWRDRWDALFGRPR
ncbi:MAG TPA: sterol desaturase family protein [Stellaceae bacterium]|nr:sterol desaturase family protein [Stellaceae bacterium]